MDRGLAVFHAAPASYTGEDLAELHLHGSPAIVESVLRGCCAAGARLARPGEFTLRAYLNGRMDLGQAEAVMTLVGARTEGAAQAACRVLGGEVGRRLGSLRSGLVDAMKWLEMAIDFPEEDQGFADDLEISRMIRGLVGEAQALLRASHAGLALSRRPRVALVGPPNVGKSSLFNALVGSERAIVTEVAGTTRDVLEAPLGQRAVEILLQDTAGLRGTVDTVERIGVARASQAALDAELRLGVFDASAPLTAEARHVFTVLRTETDFLVLNKMDRNLCSDTVQELRGWDRVFEVSALTGLGVAGLEAAIVQALGSPVGAEEALMVSTRQLSELEAATAHLKQGLDAAEGGSDPELTAWCLRESASALDRMLGVDSQQDLLDRIFQDFCLGK